MAESWQAVDNSWNTVTFKRFTKRGGFGEVCREVSGRFRGKKHSFVRNLIASGYLIEKQHKKKKKHSCAFAQAMEVESDNQHQIFKQTIDRFAQALPGGYRGSRKVAMRYIYPRTTLANFIELKSEQPPMTPAEFLELLSAVPGVLTVVPHPKSKSEQNNYGHHYQERNFLVYSQAYPRHGMEFELTTHNHEKGGSTISACYKTQGNRPRAMEAWRILKHSLAGRELNAQLVEKIDTELRKLAGASDFTDTGQPRDSVSSYSNITVASSAVEQWLLPPSSSSAQAQAEAQAQAQAEAQARAQAHSLSISVQPHPPEPVLPEDLWSRSSPPSNKGNEHLKPRDVTQADLARLIPYLQLVVNRQSGAALPSGMREFGISIVDGREWVKVPLQSRPVSASHAADEEGRDIGFHATRPDRAGQILDTRLLRPGPRQEARGHRMGDRPAAFAAINWERAQMYANPQLWQLGDRIYGVQTVFQVSCVESKRCNNKFYRIAPFWRTDYLLITASNQTEDPYWRNAGGCGCDGGVGTISRCEHDQTRG